MAINIKEILARKIRLPKRRSEDAVSTHEGFYAVTDENNNSYESNAVTFNELIAQLKQIGELIAIAYNEEHGEAHKRHAKKSVWSEDLQPLYYQGCYKETGNEEVALSIGTPGDMLAPKKHFSALIGSLQAKVLLEKILPGCEAVKYLSFTSTDSLSAANIDIGPLKYQEILELGGAFCINMNDKEVIAEVSKAAAIELEARRLYAGYKEAQRWASRDSKAEPSFESFIQQQERQPSPEVMLRAAHLHTAKSASVSR